MLQNLARLERAVRESKLTDNPLVNWWLYILLLSWVTLGIYPIIVFFQRINRRDRHFQRVNEVFRAALDCTREIAEARGKNVLHELHGVESRLKAAESSLLRPKGALLWFILTFITLGFAGLYVLYFETKDWHRLLRLEQDLLDDLSKVWARLKIVRYPVTVDLAAPDRNYWLYLFLSVITFGIWGIYWDYCVHTDPDRVFKESAQWEQVLLNSFRQLELPALA